MMQTSSTPFRERLDAQDMRLTESASSQLAKLFGEVDDEEIEAIRIYVTGGGCSGMAYGMTFTDRRTSYDRVFEGGGFNIYVDSIAMNYLQGVEIDYVQRPTGASFVFNNVFASTGGSGTCGRCGAAAGRGCGG